MLSSFNLVKAIRNFAIDARRTPEILPVVGIVSTACVVGSVFMSWKLFNTPDVSLDHSLSFQKYDAKNTQRHSY